MENIINRKKFLRISAISAAVLGGGALVGKGIFDAVTSAKEYSESRSMMGTRVEIKLVDNSTSVAKEAVAQVFSEMTRLAAVFSRFNPQTELAVLNASGRLDNASAELLEVLAQAKEFGALTDGVFDVSILPAINLMETHFAEQRLKKSQDSNYIIAPPSDQAFAAVLPLVNYENIIIDGNNISLAKEGMQITLDGIAKGYIVDKASAKLTALGYTDVLIDGGGDIAVSGVNQKAEDWQIGITHPRALAGYYAITSINSGAIATSGDYEVPNSYTNDYTYHHIINPKTARWSDLASASVWAPSCTLADILATACMALGGEKGLELVESIDGAECLLIKKDMSHLRSVNFSVSEII